MSINIPPEGKGAINLVARVHIMGQYRECFVLDANAKTQTAKVQIKGTLYPALVMFRQIQNVALKYDNGEIIQNFGAPKLSNPESVAYIRQAQNAY